MSEPDGEEAAPQQEEDAPQECDVNYSDAEGSSEASVDVEEEAARLGLQRLNMYGKKPSGKYSKLVGADGSSEEELSEDEDSEDDQPEGYMVLGRSTLKARAQAFVQVKEQEAAARAAAEKPKKKKKKAVDGSGDKPKKKAAMKPSGVPKAPKPKTTVAAAA
mmetsp:Transcript_6387/g.21365  ORF Transcript_6387/g.21365 Transcript_6387/m.21365 type:complete len:162 (+) Transcript_6387:23-508(+)